MAVQKKPISLFHIINLSFKKRNFVFLITALTVLLTHVIFNLNNSLTDNYLVQSSFNKIDSQSLIRINQDRSRMGKEFILSRDEIFTRFLEKITSREEQKKVFNNGNYSEKLGFNTLTLSAKNAAISGFLQSITVFEPKIKQDALISPSFILKMSGEEGEILELFVDDLIASISSLTYNQFKTNLSEIITSSLQNISSEQDNIIIKFNKDFLVESYEKEQRLKQKIIRLQNELTFLRSIFEQEKFNLIVKIKEQINIAKSLEVYDNNLNNYIAEPNSSVSLSFGNLSDLPQWFLYGQKALENELKVIQLRENEDSFIPNLSNIIIELDESIRLLAEIKKQKNSNKSDILSKAQFSMDYVKLDMEKIFLESIQQMKIKEVSPIIITQFATSKSLSLQRNIFIPLIFAFFFGVLLSVCSLTIVDSYKRFKNNDI